jgi:hypothetical protein
MDEEFVAECQNQFHFDLFGGKTVGGNDDCTWMVNDRHLPASTNCWPMRAPRVRR